MEVPTWKKIRIHPRRYHPWYLGAVGAVLWFCYSPMAQETYGEEINLDTIFSSGFDVLTILSGFLFAVFGMIVSTGSGIIGRLRRDETNIYKELVRAIRSTTNWGVVGAVSAVPLMVVSPDLNGFWLFYSSAWVFLVVGAGFAFLRVVNVFYGLVDGS